MKIAQVSASSAPSRDREGGSAQRAPEVARPRRAPGCSVGSEGKRGVSNGGGGGRGSLPQGP